ncbi:hypothetical protein [Deinococcus multiflagellatus]|uniref:Uncharacterized protein n=1 Tax=Deinococcus multiflagellatus TaxID=1656887 RepID=A0ABW1ZE25_9DEIO
MSAGALLSLGVLALVLLACLWLVTEPLRAAAPEDPDAPERARLEAQREQLYAQLHTLSDEAARPGLERRAALTLRALDALPPAPVPAAGCGPWRWACWPWPRWRWGPAP